jgi:tetratricopeptide (TPR) repeat protein
MTLEEPVPVAVPERSNLYQSARAIYDGFAAKISLQLLGPTTEQVESARKEQSLFEAERLYLDARRGCESVQEVYNQAVVDFQLGLLYRLQGRDEESLDHFRRALLTLLCVLKPNARVHDSISQCHYYIGKALLDRGDARDARRHLKAAAEIDAAAGVQTRERACASLLERGRLV